MSFSSSQANDQTDLLDRMAKGVSIALLTAFIMFLAGLFAYNVANLTQPSFLENNSCPLIGPCGGTASSGTPIRNGDSYRRYSWSRCDTCRINL